MNDYTRGVLYVAALVGAAVGAAVALWALLIAVGYVLIS